MKKIIIAIIVMVASVNMTYAIEKYGYVELNSIMKNYIAAKNLEIELKSKEAEIENYIKTKNNEIQKAKNETQRKELEKQVADELNRKIQAVRTYNLTELKKIETKLSAVIAQIAKKEGYTLVFNDKTVMFGAENITTKVLNEMNKMK